MRAFSIIEPLESRIAPAAAAALRLANLNGSNGFEITGVSAGDQAGLSVNGAGDVNGDGFDDLIIGAGHAAEGGTDRGAAYVVFGRQEGFGTTINLAELNGANGFKMSGVEDNGLVGHSVAAGDINHDGFSDVVIGAPLVTDGGPNGGASYVVFGKAVGFSAALDLSALDGTNGFEIKGTFRVLSGFTVATGDVNGDGFQDVIVALPQSGLSGGAAVVFGKSNGFAPSISISDLDGTNGFRFFGETKLVFSVINTGNLVAAADVNGDGFDDLVIGSRYSDSPDNGRFRGATYVLFGKAGSFADVVEAKNLDGANGFKLYGIENNDLVGSAVSTAGDVNGDGFDDLLISADSEEGGVDRGAAYVVFGKAGGFAAATILSSLDGSNGFKVSGVADQDFAGSTLSNAGDVNNDGFDDILVGAQRAAEGGSHRGASYVVFGHATAFPAALNLSALDGANGLTISGVADEDFAAASLGAAGDVNGDGTDDLIIGAPGAGTGDAGVAYVVFGASDLGSGSGGGNPVQVKLSPNHKAATFTDVDGDLAIVKTNKGSFEQENFHLRAEGLGAQLELVTLSGDASFTGARLTFDAKRQDANGDGSRDGNRRVHVGAISADGIDLTKVQVHGDLGQIDAGNPAPGKAALRSLTAFSMGAFGSTTQNAGTAAPFESAIAGDVGKVAIKGDASGTTLLVSDGGIGKVTVKGEASGVTIAVTGGGLASAAIHGNARDLAIAIDDGGLGSLSIRGDLLSTGAAKIASGENIGRITIGGDLSSSDATHPLNITALGVLAPASTRAATAIGSITVGGDVLNARILAGYPPSPTATTAGNADAGIGTLKIKGNWRGSSISAGISDTTADGFGRNDAVFPGGNADILAVIARITIEGTAAGSTGDSTDHFGITAEEIRAASIDGAALPLSPAKDNIPLDLANNDFRLLEL